MPIRKNKTIILLPIYPKYANAIMDGRKKVEFRKKNIPKTIEYVLVYSTVPEKKVIGYFKVKEVQEKTPKELWDDFGDCGEIEKDLFFDYYKGNEFAKGIVIEATTIFENPITLTDIDNNLRAPQSFRYIDDKMWKKVSRVR